MYLTQEILGIIGEKPAIAENLVFIVTGFAAVLVVLGLLSLLTRVIGFGFIRFEAGKRRAEEEAESQPDEGLAPETVAVIAAAVQTVIHHPHHIVSIRSRPSDVWSRAGRQHIFDSHQIRSHHD